MAQIPGPRTSADRLLLLGEYHVAACNRTPATASIGAAFKTVQDELKARRADREAAELAMVAPRVLVRFAEHELEQLIRAAVYAAQALDGRTHGGAAKSALVPDGVEAVVRPRGAAQKKQAEELLRRLVTHPAAAPLVAEHKPKLEAGIQTFDDALSARALAGQQLADARAREDGACENWISAYAGNAGAIQAIFKRDRAQRELYFDRFRSYRHDDGGDDDGGDDGGEGGGEGGGA